MIGLSQTEKLNQPDHSTRMDIPKKAIDLARESDHISYAFTDINCSLFVKLSNGSFNFFNIIHDLNNLWGFILTFSVFFKRFNQFDFESSRVPRYFPPFCQTFLIYS